MHNYLLMEHKNENILPFVRDMQLQALISFAQNHIQWQKTCNTYEYNEENCDLWVQGEPKNAFTTFDRHNKFSKQPNVRSSLKIFIWEYRSHALTI